MCVCVCVCVCVYVNSDTDAMNPLDVPNTAEIYKMSTHQQYQHQDQTNKSA
jgi:hypothetical protein